jgi:hypothetical protein
LNNQRLVDPRYALADPATAPRSFSKSRIVDHRDRQGTPISGYDAQIAAICRANDASLATRNEKDFAGVGVELINPWSSV